VKKQSFKPLFYIIQHIILCFFLYPSDICGKMLTFAAS